MSALPIAHLSKDALERLTRHDIVLHIYWCYRRQDEMDNHELILRARGLNVSLPVRELPVARWDDGFLMQGDLGNITEHVLHLQRRLDEYLVTYHDIYKAIKKSYTRPYTKSGLYRKGVSKEEFRAHRAKLKRELYARNKPPTKVLLVKIDGVEKTITEWSKDPICSVNRTNIYRRIREGWKPEDAILIPAEQDKKVAV